MKPLRYILLASLFFLIFSMHFTSSSDLNQDLGRHIKIGEIITHEKFIPSTNFFSYTNPDFPFVNHHWFSEVIFYGIASVFGLTPLIFLKVLMIVGSIGVLILLGYRQKYLLTTILTALLFSPLFLERSNIRPEMFGYLLFSIILYVFFQYPKQKKLLYLLPVCMLLWINLHISFIFGFVVIGLLLLKIIWTHYEEKKTFELRDVSILIVSGLITILNPHGVFGLLYPLNIFQNYGYTIVENQNIFFLNSLMMNPQIRWLFLLSLLIIGAIIILLYKKKYIEAVLLILFSIAEILQIRHMPFFALVAIPTVSLSIHLLLQKIKIQEKYAILASTLLSVFCFGISIFFIQNVYYQTFDLQRSFGSVVNEDGKKAADFILSHNLPAKIFNNFDIGGYEIYKLYPKYKVFVDNRPEAYPAEFFQNVYIKLQTDPDLRKQIFKKYNIQTIFFAHTDQTYWADAFIKEIAADKMWRIVYLDDTMIVMTKDNKLPDIRTEEKKLSDLIDMDSDYVSLMKLNHILSLLDRNDLSEKAYMKAHELNPFSCTINKSMYFRYADSPSIQKAQEIKSNFWYCF